MIGYLLLSLVGGLIGLWTLVQFIRQGQFEDVEEVKYQLFREEDGR